MFLFHGFVPFYSQHVIASWTVSPGTCVAGLFFSVDHKGEVDAVLSSGRKTIQQGDAI